MGTLRIAGFNETREFTRALRKSQASRPAEPTVEEVQIAKEQIVPCLSAHLADQEAELAVETQSLRQMLPSFPAALSENNHTLVTNFHAQAQKCLALGDEIQFNSRLIALIQSL